MPNGPSRLFRLLHFGGNCERGRNRMLYFTGSADQKFGSSDTPKGNQSHSLDSRERGKFSDRRPKELICRKAETEMRLSVATGFVILAFGLAVACGC